MKKIDYDQINILINFAHQKKGGGQNVSLNFLQSLLEVENKMYRISFVAVRDSVIHKFISNHFPQNEIIFMPISPIARILKEVILGRYFLKKLNVDVIYTYFGFSLYPKSIPQVCGSADSNIFFPEINFWSDYKGVRLFKKKCVDKYRIWGVRRAAAVIFENRSLEIRARKLFNVKKSIFIKPSIDFNGILSNDGSVFYQKRAPTGLFFCSWQKNKNYLIIPEVACELKKRDINFHFIITAPNDRSSYHVEFTTKIKEFNVEDRVFIIGPIDKSQISDLYSKIDLVFLLSKLESFSNNIIEAWYFRKPLIINDANWSRSICSNAAFYVERNNVMMIADAIEILLKESKMYESLVDNGIYEYLNYPNSSAKVIQELAFIRSVYDSF
jgi:glycosyltransferase involved in cell wall biosynthesis